jgi:hypothetical protein
MQIQTESLEQTCFNVVWGNSTRFISGRTRKPLFKIFAISDRNKSDPTPLHASSR